MLREAIGGDLERQETGFYSDYIFPLRSTIIPVRICFSWLIHLGMHPQCRQLYWGLCLQKGKTPVSYNSQLWPMCCQAGWWRKRGYMKNEGFFSTQLKNCKTHISRGHCGFPDEVEANPKAELVLRAALWLGSWVTLPFRLLFPPHLVRSLPTSLNRACGLPIVRYFLSNTRTKQQQLRTC